MPAWVSLILPWVLRLLARYGLPALEARFPALKPIVDEILKVIGGLPPSEALHAAAAHYNTCVGNACAPTK